MWRIPISIVFIILIIVGVVIVALRQKRVEGLVDEVVDLESENERLKRERQNASNTKPKP